MNHYLRKDGEARFFFLHLRESSRFCSWTLKTILFNGFEFDICFHLSDFQFVGDIGTKMLINKFRRGEGRGVGTWSKIVPIRISHFPRGTNIFSSMDEVIITEVTTLLSILFGEDVYKV